MTQYQRITGKVFGGNATATGNDPQIAQFGSALANTFIGTTDPETIQQLPAWGQGWIGAVTPETQFPPLPEMTGAMKVLSHQICGILQQGVSTWDSGTIYYTGNFVSLNGRLYISQVDENQGNNPATDTTNWQEFSSGGGLEIGDIGIAPLGIDETRGKRRYLNGQIIIQEQYTIFTEKVKSAISLYPTLECTEQEWQTIATMSVGGQVGKFVVDDVAGTIRLPKIIMPIQGLTDLSKLGEIVEAGLPNIEGSYSSLLGGGATNAEGALYQQSLGDRGPSGNESAYWRRLLIDASLSNPIYNNSDTVQQEQIQYPYFIQVATGSETEDNIINTLELNNPFVLLESKYFETEIYNISWLLANGTYNGSNAVHPSAYQALLVENNTDIAVGSTVTLSIGTEYTKRGLSVKQSTDSDITEEDFILNTTDETFRLPIKVNLASGKAVVGNGIALGLTDGTENFGLSRSVSEMELQAKTQLYGSSLPSSYSQTGTQTGNGSALGLATDATKSGAETSDNDLFLYFYVGETVQNANLINAGRIEETLSFKANTNANNLTSAGKSLISGFGMPSNQTINVTLGASGTYYTAPANGYFVAFTNSGNTGRIALINSTNGMISAIAPYLDSVVGVFIPVKRNDEIRFEYQSTTISGFLFIYAEGEQ